MKNNNKKLVFVGVSGGVDSSVSAGLLKDAGYDVVGVFIRTWTPEWIDCTWRDERRDAMRVCAHLDIPFLECDAVDAYKKGVADYMITEYARGHVPNPDVMCNREVKWGIFLQFARSHGADFIATGHYAQNIDNQLVKGIDPAKDQSYFLWTLQSEDLAQTLFPIGHLEKKQVRVLAEKYNLPTATKKDSQGVCFIGEIDMKEFLQHYIEPKVGDVLNEQGEVIGTHDGAVFFALGERHGFTITKKGTHDMPYFIIAKDVEKNTITVSNTIPDDSKQATDTYIVNSTYWRTIPQSNKKYQAQIRYHGEYFSVNVSVADEKTTVTFEKPILISSGQSIVVYNGDICLGGGIVA